MSGVIVISRFRIAEDAGDEFLDRARRAIQAFAERPGYLRGRIGRAADDPALWTIVTEWSSVGAFRRSLSGFDVKMYAAPLLAESIDEPAAFEVIVAVDGTVAEVAPSGRTVEGVTAEVAPSGRAADAGSTRIGEGATPHAPRSVDPL
jgi:heme oxygenase (mycobilin-producing)